MPTDWIPNSGSQLERAIRAMFIARGDATAADCHASNESGDRTGLATGITDILAVMSTATDTEPSGNEKWTVRIQNKFGAVVQPDEPNPQLNRVEMDRRVGRQMLAMMRGTYSLDETCADITTEGRAIATPADGTAEAIQAAANDADMTEFTCLFGRYLGATRGQPEDGSCAWIEVRNFELVAVPVAITV